MNSQNRNLFTAVALSLLILLGFHHFYEVPHLQQMRQLAAEEQAKAGTERQVAGGTGDSPAARLSALSEGGPIVDRVAAVGQTSRLKITNPLLYGSLAKTGIRFDDLTFGNYFTALDHAHHVDLLSPKGTESPYYATFGWVPAKTDTPVPDDNTAWKLTDSQALTPDHPVTMAWDNGHGLIFHRTIALDADYMFTVTQSVDNKTGEEVTLYPYASVTRQGEPVVETPTQGDKKPDDKNHSVLNITPQDGELGVLNGRLSSFSYLKMKSNQPMSATDQLTYHFKGGRNNKPIDPSQLTQASKGGWLGCGDKYWLVAIIPDQDEDITAEFRHEKSAALDIFQADYKAGAKTIQPGASITETSRLFAGAKRVDLLTHYRDTLNIPRFDLAVDWGKFLWVVPLRPLTKPFFYGIDYLAKLLGNFGLGIVAFTIVIRILILPLAWKTFREMNRMGDLTPQMTAIKEKHGRENKQAIQAEILELYQREKVNPVSGCLPVLFQIPIFLSLFNVLSTTIEMRQQPFYWYVHDLSAEDPTNVFTLFGLLPNWHLHLFNLDLPPHLGLLPLILGFTLLALQLLSPKVGDPLHRKMMLINPVIFTFFMAHLPVGLVIYYIWSNTISVGQQRFIRKFYRKRYRKDDPTLLTLPEQSPK